MDASQPPLQNSPDESPSDLSLGVIDQTTFSGQRQSLSNDRFSANGPKPKPNSTLFLSLPPELKLQVVGYLSSISDIRNLRFASKDWAAAGARSLFQNGFSIRPHRPDMRRLNAASCHSDIAKGIRSIQFYIGDASPEQFKAAIDLECKRLPKAKEHFLRRKEKQLVYYMAKADSVGEHCSRVMLDQIFRLLPNVIELKLLSEEFPFAPFEVLEPAWETMLDRPHRFNKSHCFVEDTAITRYFNILSASVVLPSKVQALIVDMFPIDCILYTKEEFRALHGPKVEFYPEISPEKMKITEQAFEHLKALDIGFMGHAGNLRHESVAHAGALGRLIGSTKHLEILNVAQTVQDVTPEFRDAFSETFFKNTFPVLRSLRLLFTEAKEKTILLFLETHANTLKRLHLGMDAVRIDFDRSWKDFLTEMKNKTKLEKVEVLANGSEALVYNVDWIEIPTSQKAAPKPVKLIEMFVRGECPWPMHGDDPDEVRGWKPRFIGGHVNFGDMTAQEKEEMLADDWETDREEDGEEDREEDSDEDGSEGSDVADSEEEGDRDSVGFRPDDEDDEWVDDDQVEEVELGSWWSGFF